jgi:hypothetical protein
VQRLSAPLVLLASAVSLLLIPSVIFVSAGVSEGMSLSQTFAALVEQFSADRNNLGTISALGLLPWALLALFLGIVRRVTRSSAGLTAYAVGGAIPIIVVIAFVNLEFWPAFLPARVFLGFPHGLEFVIGPLFFAPVGIGVGFLAVWISRRRRV